MQAGDKRGCLYNCVYCVQDGVQVVVALKVDQLQVCGQDMQACRKCRRAGRCRHAGDAGERQKRVCIQVGLVCAACALLDASEHTTSGMQSAVCVCMCHAAMVLLWSPDAQPATRQHSSPAGACGLRSQ
jgi:hypothetical protein